MAKREDSQLCLSSANKEKTALDNSLERSSEYLLQAHLNLLRLSKGLKDRTQQGLKMCKTMKINEVCQRSFRQVVVVGQCQAIFEDS